MEWEEVFEEEDLGKVYKLRRVCPIYDDDGDLQMVLGYGFDITKRRIAEENARENERLLKSINANLQDGIYRYSPQKGFLYVNDAFLRIFNYSNWEAFIKDSTNFFSYDQEARKELINIRGKVGSFNNKEIKLKRADGTHFWGLVNCKKDFDEEENVLFDGAISDITEMKETERMLKEKNEELKKTNKELDQFIYSASHDLRAPLTSILGIVNLAEIETDEAFSNYLEMIRQSANKLDGFVKDLIDYYRNSRSSTEYQKIALEQDIINDAVEKLNHMEGAEKITIHKNINLKNSFYSDVYRLKIIVSNLLSNAIKYHDLQKEHPYIAIEAEEDSDKVRLDVVDNGKGIQEDKIDKVFGMFLRGDEGSEGSGLGLYIVQEAVKKIEGQIKVSSTFQLGSRFTVYLPKENGLKND